MGARDDSLRAQGETREEGGRSGAMPRAFDPAKSRRPLFDALIAASKTYGPKKPILEDQERIRSPTPT